MQDDHHRLVTMAPAEYGTKQCIGATAGKVLLPQSQTLSFANFTGMDTTELHRELWLQMQALSVVFTVLVATTFIHIHLLFACFSIFVYGLCILLTTHVYPEKF